MQFIALFLPGFLGVNIFAKIEENKVGIVHYISSYCIFVLWTNIFTMFTITYVLGIEGVVSDALNSFSFFMIYTVMSCFFAIIGALIGKVIKKNISKLN